MPEKGGIAAFVDAEHALDPEYARALGVKVDDLLISQPDTGEQALDITEELVRSGAVDVVVVDSVAALVPKAEIEGSMEDQQMGLQARLMSKALRKLTGVIGKTNTTVIFINQLRMKIGVMYGNPETTTGGNALKYYASVRMEIKRTEGVKGDDGDVGNHVRVRVLKNKVAPPFRTAEFDIIFGKGICKVGNILDVAVNLDIVKKAGSWFSFNEEKLGQGRDKARDFLTENPDILAQVETLVREKLAQQIFMKTLAQFVQKRRDDLGLSPKGLAMKCNLDIALIEESRQEKNFFCLLQYVKTSPKALDAILKK